MENAQTEKIVKVQGESRIGKLPIKVPAGIEVSLQSDKISFKSNTGNLEHRLHHLVVLKFDEQARTLTVSGKPGSDSAKKFVGTTRAVLYNSVSGLGKAFEKKY